MIKRFRLAAALPVLAALIFVACKKKETIAVDNESQSVIDNSVAEQEYMAMLPAVQQLAINTRGTGAQARNTASPCDTLTRVSGDTLYGKAGHADPTYTFNVSAAGCAQVLPDGKARTGGLSVRLTNKINLAGARMIVKMSQYNAGDIRYSCDSMIVTTLTANSQFTRFNVKLVNGICQTASWAVKYSFDRTVTNYAKGNPAGTVPYASFYGTSSGVNRAGKAFTTIVSASGPLIRKRDCRYITSGALELTPEGFSPRTVDYGAGNCDEDATFSVNGNTIAFKLK